MTGTEAFSLIIILAVVFDVSFNMDSICTQNDFNITELYSFKEIKKKQSWFGDGDFSKKPTNFRRIQRQSMVK